MGYNRETTPTLDTLAESSVVYENAIAPAVPTGPSMMGTFTGEYCPIDAEDFTQEAWLKEFSRRHTLADVLSEEGYTTAAFHSNPYASTYFGFDSGFDEFHDFIGEKELQTLTTDSGINEFISTIQRLVQGKGTNVTWEKMYPQVRDWLDQVQEPYFLWVLLLDTHTPYLPPKSHREWSDHGKMRLIYEHWKAQQQNWELSDGPTVSRLRNAYDDTIRYADDFIKQLKTDTEDDDPIFVVHGDHGEGFGEHDFLRHPPKLYEELTHVPLILHNTDAKSQVQNPVSLRNLPATIAELIDVEGEVPGESFMEEDNEWVFTQVFNEGQPDAAVRTTEWKFMSTEKEGEELYHIGRDPHEQKNLIAEYPDLARELRKLVRNHTRDQMERRKIHEITTRNFSQ
jgi:arylsulfatase